MRGALPRVRPGGLPAGARSGQGPVLVGAAVTGPQDELRSVRGIGAGVVQALTGSGVHQLPALSPPLLVGAAVAGPQLDEGAVGGFGTGDVHAAADVRW